MPRASASSDAFTTSSAAPDTAHAGASLTARDVAAWLPQRRSIDAEILPEQGRLVGRARDLDRNNGVARGALQTILDNVVGTGLRLNPRPDYVALGKSKSWADGWSREVRALWSTYYWSTACHAGDTLTGDQLTAQNLRSVLLNGEAIALPLWIDDRGDGFATKIQTVESDRLSNPPNMPQRTGFRGGIEFDQFGAPVNYWIRKTHPGDAILDGSFGTGTAADWERIPRRTDFGRLRVLHIFDSERSGQSRGKPLLSAVLPQFKNLDRYTQAELQAAVVNALVAMTIETPLDQSSILELFNGDHKAYLAARDTSAVQLSSGGILPLFPGDKAQGFIPTRPATGFDAFVTNMYRLIGAGLDLPLELVLKDFSRTNYSSARAALLEAWRAFNRRRDWLATSWLDPLFALWFEECANDGRIDAPDFYTKRAAYLRCRWIGPGRGWIDPVKEAEAARIRIGANLSTLEDECAEQGRDWEEVLEQRASELARMHELGIPSDASVAPIARAAPAAGPDRGEGSGDERDDGDDADPAQPNNGPALPVDE